jgi:hypothetical protein
LCRSEIGVELVGQLWKPHGKKPVNCTSRRSDFEEDLSELHIWLRSALFNSSPATIPEPPSPRTSFLRRKPLVWQRYTARQQETLLPKVQLIDQTARQRHHAQVTTALNGLRPRGHGSKLVVAFRASKQELLQVSRACETMRARHPEQRSDKTALTTRQWM